MKRATWVIAVLSLVMWAGQAQGTPTLDQEFAPTEINLWAVCGDLTRAQTFTVGTPGLLSRFEVLLVGSVAVNTRRFEIHPTTAGVPLFGSAPLASAMITYGNSADFYGADISAFGIHVNAGDVLAVVDPGQDGGSGWWSGRFTAPLYAGGQLYTTTYLPPDYTIPTTVYELQDDRDLAFRTYVETGPTIPAPAAIVLAGIGATAVGWLRRRRAL